ncbi:MAG TPA: hypothetical protein PKE33_06800 [Kiritimatiellia bacterium]|nr:hypothetical protein [Kiritimatiellia bacterium]
MMVAPLVIRDRLVVCHRSEMDWSPMYLPLEEGVVLPTIPQVRVERLLPALVRPGLPVVPVVCAARPPVVVAVVQLLSHRMAWRVLLVMRTEERVVPAQVPVERAVTTVLPVTLAILLVVVAVVVEKAEPHPVLVQSVGSLSPTRPRLLALRPDSPSVPCRCPS